MYCDIVKVLIEKCSKETKLIQYLLAKLIKSLHTAIIGLKLYADFSL